MKRLYFLLLIIFFSIKCNAQFEQLARTDSTGKWRLKLSATGLYTSGNSPKSLFSNTAIASTIQKKWGIISRQDYQHGTVRRTVNYNDYRSENLIVLNPKKKWVPFARLFLETNVARKINFRYQPTVGILYKIVNTSKNSLFIFSGFAYESTHYKGANLEYIDNHGSQMLNTFRANIGINGSKTLVKNRLLGNYKLWRQQSVNHAIDYRYHAEFILQAPITKHLSLTSNVFYTYEKIKLVGLLPNEFQWTYGLSYNNF